MYQFFVDPSQTEGEEIFITGDDVNHMKNVLRMRVGEEVLVSNGEDGKAYHCEIRDYEDDGVRLEVTFVEDAAAELPCQIYLFQGLCKGEKMELIIQKAVELGVHQIIPVAMHRSVVKYDEKKAEAKVKRWQGISEAAAKQSKRGIIPEVGGILSYKEAMQYAASLDVKLLPYEHAKGMDHTRKCIKKIQPGQSVAIWIGPEGGFEDSEIELAEANSFEVITLGRRILRTETAGMAVLAMLTYQLDE